MLKTHKSIIPSKIRPMESSEAKLAASNLKRSVPLSSNRDIPLGSLSLDLDNLWSYMKTHGDQGWESFPSYLDTFIPMVLDILDDLNLHITFFIVGQDAALEKNHDALKLITQRGHEVGNHSFNHEPWLHLYPKDQIRKEIIETGELIQRTTGQKPLGFRGPGFSWSTDLLEVLIQNNYLYDASTLPTFLGPLARAYYFWKSDLTKEEKKKRKKLFGGFSQGLQPINAYYFHIEPDVRILEIPVTTMPFFKTPFHLSYLLYLSRFSHVLMVFYLKLALQMCMMTGTRPSFLLHPLDLIGGDIVRELAFFPGMDLSSNKKLKIFKQVINILKNSFSLTSLNHHAEFLVQKSNIN